MEIDKSEVPEHFQTVAVDSDLIVYRSAFSAQHTFWDVYHQGEFVERFPSAKDADAYIGERCDDEFGGDDKADYSRESALVIYEEERARDACDTIIEHIKERVPGDKYKFYITDSAGNYREEIAKTLVYKGNRPPKPEHYQVAKDHILQNWRAIITWGAEADDACCVVGSRGYYSDKYDTCVVTADKDLKGSPGYIYNFVKDKWYYVTELEADRFFFTQCITGDKAVDNILGLENVSDEFRLKYGIKKTKGIGKAGATKLLEDCKTAQEMYDRVKEAYQSYHGDNWRTILDEMGQLLYMQRKKGEIFSCDWYENDDSE